MQATCVPDLILLTRCFFMLSVVRHQQATQPSDVSSYNAERKAKSLRTTAQLSCLHSIHHAQTAARCRCGKYCLDSAKYSEDNVGPKAMQLQFLQRNVNSTLKNKVNFSIENTVSIPFGTISEILESHYENSGPATQVRRAIAVEEDAGHEVRSKNWKSCR